MAISKANTGHLSSQATTATSTAQNISTANVAEMYIEIVQVGVATTAAQVTVQCSDDGGTKYYDLVTLKAGLAAATYQFPPVSAPTSADRIRVAYTQQSGGTSSSCTAQCGTAAL